MWPFRKKPKQEPVVLPPWFYEDAFLATCQQHKEGDRELCSQYYGWLMLRRTEPGAIFEALVVRMGARWEGWIGAKTFFRGYAFYRDFAENTDPDKWYGETQFWKWAKGRFPQDAKVLDAEHVLQGRPRQLVRPTGPEEHKAFQRMKRRAQGWYWYVNNHARKRTS